LQQRPPSSRHPYLAQPFQAMARQGNMDTRVIGLPLGSGGPFSLRSASAPRGAHGV